ncbi:MAG: hypothetical protein ACI4T5_04350 [Prevotella sp.]
MEKAIIGRKNEIARLKKYIASDIKLIICGSATSWMLNKIINARGGLHNRVTHKILVSPFTLHETEL